MSNAFEDLIGILSQMVEKLRLPVEQLRLLAEAEQLPEVMEANAALLEVLGMTPLPVDHPDFISVAGSLGEAGGAIDIVTEVYQLVREKANDAIRSVENSSTVIQSVIMGMQQGHS